MDFRGLKAFLRLADVVVMVAGFLLAAIISSPAISIASFSDLFAMRLNVGNVILFIAILLSWMTFMAAFRVYDHVNASMLLRTVVAFLKAAVVGSVALIALAVVFDVSLVDFRFMLVFCSIVFLVGSGLRVLIAVLQQRRFWRKTRKDYILIGMNPRAMEVADSLKMLPERSYRLLGYVDVGGEGHPVRDNAGDFKRLSGFDGLPDILRSTKIDEVVLCLPLKSYYDETSEVIALCEEQGIVVRILADFFQTRVTHSRVEQFANRSVITVPGHNISGHRAAIKRAMDIALSAAAIICLSPVFVVAAVVIAVSSPGPIFFSQERVGLNKKIFQMLKFRTMVSDAEVLQGALESMNEAEGPAFKIRNDPRVTPVGRFLRKFSIDELPQLINVVKGDMSLVGPRPLPLRDYAGFSEDWHRRRLSVRPGITGLWQVKDRDHSSFSKWMKLDMQYIDQWSLLLDLKIIIQTVPAVLRGSGE